MFTKQHAEVALQFLNRVQLNGAEVEAFCFVRNALVEFMQTTSPNQPQEQVGVVFGSPDADIG